MICAPSPVQLAKHTPAVSALKRRFYEMELSYARPPTPAAGDEAEAQRLQQEKTYHYVRWILLVAVAAVIAGLIAVGLAQLR